jgi:hypothetical protein
LLAAKQREAARLLAGLRELGPAHPEAGRVNERLEQLLEQAQGLERQLGQARGISGEA